MMTILPPPRVQTLVAAGSLALWLTPAAVLAPPHAHAADGARSPRVPAPSHALEPHHEFGASMAEALDLTEEQAEAVRRIRLDYDTMTIDRRAAIRTGEVELAALLDDHRADLDAIERKVRAIGALETDLMMGRVKALLKLKKVLTRGQYETFQNLLLKRMEALAEGQGHGGQ